MSLGKLGLGRLLRTYKTDTGWVAEMTHGVKNIDGKTEVEAISLLLEDLDRMTTRFRAVRDRLRANKKE